MAFFKFSKPIVSPVPLPPVAKPIVGPVPLPPVVSHPEVGIHPLPPVQLVGVHAPELSIGLVPFHG